MTVKPLIGFTHVTNNPSPAPSAKRPGYDPDSTPPNADLFMKMTHQTAEESPTAHTMPQTPTIGAL